MPHNDVVEFITRIVIDEFALPKVINNYIHIANKCAVFNTIPIILQDDKSHFEM